MSACMPMRSEVVAKLNATNQFVETSSFFTSETFVGCIGGELMMAS